MIFETAPQKLYHVLLNKSLFKFFLKAEVFLDHRFNELEGFWCWSQSSTWEAAAWTPLSLLFAPPAPQVVFLLWSSWAVFGIRSRISVNTWNSQQLIRAAALRVLLRCSTPASVVRQFLEALIFFWNRYGFPYPSFCLVTSVSSLEHTRY